MSISNKSQQGLGKLWAHRGRVKLFPGVESVCEHVTQRQRMPFGICQESLLEKQGVTALPQQPNHTQAQMVHSTTGVGRAPRGPGSGTREFLGSNWQMKGYFRETRSKFILLTSGTTVQCFSPKSPKQSKEEDVPPTYAAVGAAGASNHFPNESIEKRAQALGVAESVAAPGSAGTF